MTVTVKDNVTDTTRQDVSRSPRKQSRRSESTDNLLLLLGVGLILLFFVLITFAFWMEGRPAPSSDKNALLVHLETKSCDASVLSDGLLMRSETSEGVLGKRTQQSFQAFKQVGECTKSAVGGSRGAVTVWATQPVWPRDQELELQVGNRIDAAPRFVSQPASRLRVDHSHVLLGILDLTEIDDPVFVPAERVPSYVEKLAGRQDCEKKWACGGEYQHANLLTLETLQPKQ